LSIIPQDPTLFTGTIRSNLDPFDKHSDLDIWQVLRAIHLSSVVENLPSKLDSPVVECKLKKKKNFFIEKIYSQVEY
jgi:ATP-binding cassette subfamily C (CFTR/MRP) protein 1